MKRTYKYRLLPNKEQTKVLDEILSFCRFLYNCALEERITYYKRFGKTLSYASQSNELPEIRRFFSEDTENILAQTLQQVLKRLDTAYQNFFRKLKEKAGEAGLPRFKGESRFRSICIPQPIPDLSKGCVKKLPNNKLKISGIPGEIKVKWHREIPDGARCKQVRIVKGVGHYYVMIYCDNVNDEVLAPTGKTVGVDLGINSFITLDDGKQFHHPKPYKTSKEKLAFLNKKLARKKAGPNNRKNVLIALRRENERTRNIREDFQRKIAKQLIVENDAIIIEKLDIRELMSKSLGPEATPKEKAIFKSHKENMMDASWGSFTDKLIYKAESAGRKVIQVDPRYTSMMCSSCGHMQDMPQEVRTYDCDACGTILDRDLNAAINIRNKGLGASLAIPKVFQKSKF